MINWLKSILCEDCSGKDRRISELEETLVLCESKIKELSDELDILKLSGYQGCFDKLAEYEELLESYHYVFEDKKPISKPECLNLFKQVTSSKPFLAFGDDRYSTVSKEEMGIFLDKDKLNLKNHYVTEKYDCDDFSFRLKGNITTQHNSDIAFFIVWSSRHAFNAFIDHDKKVWYIEPQTDQILDPHGQLDDLYTDIKIVIG